MWDEVRCIELFVLYSVVAVLFRVYVIGLCFDLLSFIASLDTRGTPIES